MPPKSPTLPPPPDPILANARHAIWRTPPFPRENGNRVRKDNRMQVSLLWCQRWLADHTVQCADRFSGGATSHACFHNGGCWVGREVRQSMGNHCRGLDSEQHLLGWAVCWNWKWSKRKSDRRTNRWFHCCSAFGNSSQPQALLLDYLRARQVFGSHPKVKFLWRREIENAYRKCVSTLRRSFSARSRRLRRGIHGAVTRTGSSSDPHRHISGTLRGVLRRCASLLPRLPRYPNAVPTSHLGGGERKVRRSPLCDDRDDPLGNDVGAAKIRESKAKKKNTQRRRRRVNRIRESPDTSTFGPHIISFSPWQFLHRHC